MNSTQDYFGIKFFTELIKSVTPGLMRSLIVRKLDVNTFSRELSSKEINQLSSQLVVIVSVNSSLILLGHLDFDINLLGLGMHPIKLQKLQNMGIVNALGQVLQTNVNLGFIGLHDLEQVVLVKQLFLRTDVGNVLIHLYVVFSQWVLHFFVLVVLFRLV